MTGAPETVVMVQAFGIIHDDQARPTALIMLVSFTKSESAPKRLVIPIRVSVYSEHVGL